MSEEFYGPDLAAVHDEGHGDVARDAAACLINALRAGGLRTGLVVDLGCGSGILAAELTAHGYRVAGVDLSTAMLDLARSRVPDGHFAVGSWVDAEFGDGPVAAVSAVGEVCCYGTDPGAGLEAISALARRAHAALAPGGVLLLDAVGPGRNGAPVRHVFRRDAGWSMQVHSWEGDGRLERHITVYRHRADGTVRRTDEHHVHLLWPPEAIAARLEAAGFTVRTSSGYGGTTGPVPGWTVFLARR